LATLTNATHNPFKKNKDRKIAMSKMKSNTIGIPKTLASETVPTLTKQSYWDFQSSAWSTQTATKSVYSNDLLITEYMMNYLQTDTFYRITYTYNANKQLIQTIGSTKSGPNSYTPNFRYSITYSNNNLKTVYLGENYDTQTQTWNLMNRETEELNTRGESTRYVNEQYNNGVWEIQNAYSRFYTYLNNNSNKIVEMIDSSYSFNTMQLEANYREVKTYNANEEVVYILNYANMGFGLRMTTKDSIFYTAGVPTKLVSYSYDTLTSTFNREMKFDDIAWSNFNSTTDLFYNEPLGYVISIWDNNAWQFEERTATTFTDNFGSYLRLTEVYNSSNVWVNQYRYKEIFDSRLNFIESSDENYNIQTNAWVMSYGQKYLLQYDMSNNIIEEINENFNITNNTYEKGYRYEYSNFITIASGFNTSKNTIEVTLYPNPSADGRVSVNVKMEEETELSIKITDLKGSIIYSEKKELGKGLNTVELSGLQQGMYVVEMSTDAGLSRVKLIVK
jgi:hypothetical protein